ncbi:peptide/bleomycin uptake transporter [Rubricella aquisinus]|uniref:Peptide/bleomycin uptake transporter n=1 Tax=Rubricella aquisinus TaxID=2028108 RepID=A0A840X8Y5_9RHOB|nr:peptide/bleomycin uptake transporter [Rubricella aquisinus]
MFESFFPRPKLLVLSATIYALICVLGWYLIPLKDMGGTFSIGQILGWDFPIPLTEGADEETAAIFEEAQSGAQSFWLYQYVLTCYTLFTLIWLKISDHKWARWSIAGSALIIFVTWFQVQLDVFFNAWYRDFFDLIQVALAEEGAVTLGEYYGQLATFLMVALPYVILVVMKLFFTSHYVFRWRTAMNDRYTGMWEEVRDIEGASQRIQEDTQRFSSILQSLGVSVIDSVMTLIAFLPILWGLSVYVSEIPLLGEVPQALVIVAILWSVFGTGLMALAGYRLPGLEFRNQRVEAAYRKELVLGEDYMDRAQPLTLGELFGNVRRNYFRLYLEYTYFNVIRITYLQIGNLIPMFAMGPTIVAAGVTFGLFQQILNAFGRVENSFQFLVNSWPTIIDLISIHKRLAAFEAEIEGRRLSAIEQEPETRAV